MDALLITRYVLTAPAFLGWLFPLVAWVTFSAQKLELVGDGILIATWRPWVTAQRRWLAKIRWPFGRVWGRGTPDETRSFWRYSTTLSRGMVMQPGYTDRIMAHERVHVRQVEDRLLLSLVLAVVVAASTHSLHWLLLWPSGVTWQIPNFIGTILRGGHAYLDAEHERSAYAQTDTRNDGRSWLDEHLSRPRGW